MSATRLGLTTTELKEAGDSPDRHPPAEGKQSASLAGEVDPAALMQWLVQRACLRDTALPVVQLPELLEAFHSDKTEVGMTSCNFVELVIQLRGTKSGPEESADLQKGLDGEGAMCIAPEEEDYHQWTRCAGFEDQWVVSAQGANVSGPNEPAWLGLGPDGAQTLRLDEWTILATARLESFISLANPDCSPKLESLWEVAMVALRRQHDNDPENLPEMKAFFSRQGATRQAPSLANADLSKLILAGADLSYINLAGANLSNTNLVNAKLSNTNLANAELREAKLASAVVTGANLTGANLEWANLTGANLTGANLTNAWLANATLLDVNLTDANLTQADFFRANLTDALLVRAKMAKARLDKALCRGANLSEAVVTDASFSGTNVTDIVPFLTELRDMGAIKTEEAVVDADIF